MKDKFLNLHGLSEVVTLLEKYIEQYKQIIISQIEPENSNVDIWINNTEKEIFNVPEIKDDFIISTDTWSSEKINTEIQKKYHLRLFYRR